LTCIPYKLIDRGRVQHTLNSVVKESALARIDSISDQFDEIRYLVYSRVVLQKGGNFSHRPQLVRIRLKRVGR
jgi:hypothetical protein